MKAFKYKDMGFGFVFFAFGLIFSQPSSARLSEHDRSNTLHHGLNSGQSFEKRSPASLDSLKDLDEDFEWIDVPKQTSIQQPSAADVQESSIPDPQDDFVWVEKSELCSSSRFEPMVKETDSGVSFNPHFIALAPAVLDLVDLSYIRSKSHRDDGEAYKSWNIKTFRAIRGLVFQDPKAGFVAYTESDRDFLPPSLQSQAGPVMVVVFHGSINNADWFTNYEALPADLSDAQYTDFNLEGKVHRGFLRKYSTASQELMNLIDNRLETLSTEQRKQIKIYVTGHSQGAALAQLATAHLIQHLSSRHPDLLSDSLAEREGKTNVGVNRVNGWFLGAPAVFDRVVGKSFVEKRVGRNNMIRQNVRGDLVPNLSKPLRKFTGADYGGLGVLLYQKGLEAFKDAVYLNFQGVLQNLYEGELTYAFKQLTWDFLKLLGSAPHFVSATEYRGHGFTPVMVHSEPQKMAQGVYEGQSHSGVPWYIRWIPGFLR